jgi:iron(II)-dependent oxidoreductase
MAGNVWEWTRSLWGSNAMDPAFKYPYEPDDGRENLLAGDSVRRVLRGGSWSSASRLIRCTAQYRLYPDFRHIDYGFRIVVSPV